MRFLLDEAGDAALACVTAALYAPAAALLCAWITLAVVNSMAGDPS